MESETSRAYECAKCGSENVEYTEIRIEKKKQGKAIFSHYSCKKCNHIGTEHYNLSWYMKT